jgi:hypothetical protein
VPPGDANSARPDDELTRQLTGLRYPMTTQELRAVAVRLLLPARILQQLDRLPLHMRFHSAAEVRDRVADGSGPALRRTRPRPPRARGHMNQPRDDGRPAGYSPCRSAIADSHSSSALSTGPRG